MDDRGQTDEPSGTDSGAGNETDSSPEESSTETESRGTEATPGLDEHWTVDEYRVSKGWGSKTQYSDTVAVFDGDVIAGARNGTLASLDGETGDVQWTTALNERIRRTRLLVAEHLSPPTAFVGNTVTGLDPTEGVLTAIDLNTGDVRWEREADTGKTVMPVLADDGLFVGFGGDGFSIERLDPNSGNQHWSITEEQAEEFHSSDNVFFTGGISPPIDGLVYVSLANTTIGIDADTGTVETASGTPETPFIGYENPGAVDDGRFFVCGTDVFAMDSTLDEIWSFEPFSGAVTPPTLASDLLLFGSRDQGVYALDRTGGTQQWRFMTDDEVAVSPVVLEDRIVAGSNDGNVYLLDRASGEELDSATVGGAVQSLARTPDGVAVGTRERIAKVSFT